MERTVWGWFDAAPVAVRDPQSGVVHPVRMSTSEAVELGVEKRRMVVFDCGDLLEVIPAEVSGVSVFEESDFCVHFSAPDSADWLLIRRRDGAKARIRRDLGLK